MQDNAIYHDDIHRKIQHGLNFILNHFQEPLFPRKIMTKQLGYQVEVFNKEGIYIYMYMYMYFIIFTYTSSEPFLINIPYFLVVIILYRFNHA
jgi:hypothetical protein